MKPFRAHLAEQEQDYEYKLCSVDNIHGEEMSQKLRLALGRYGLISMEPMGVQTKVQDTEKAGFGTTYPFLPVYITKFVFSNPLSSRAAIQSVALFTRIKEDMLSFLDMKDEPVVDGADAEQHAHPVEVEGKGSQAEVGDERAKSLVSDLMKDIAAQRDANTVEVPVYEGFTASHHDIEKIIGRKVRRGFYIAESEGSGVGTITGPFKTLPDNYDYVDTLPTATVVESMGADNVMEYKVKYAEAEHQKPPADAGGKGVGQRMSVEVTDQDTGETYSINVRATSNNSARAKAVEIIASRTGFPKERFLPTSPDPAPAN